MLLALPNKKSKHTRKIGEDRSYTGYDKYFGQKISDIGSKVYEEIDLARGYHVPTNPQAYCFTLRYVIWRHRLYMETDNKGACSNLSPTGMLDYERPQTSARVAYMNRIPRMLYDERYAHDTQVYQTSAQKPVGLPLPENQYRLLPRLPCNFVHNSSVISFW